jgi:hypothetical protein
MGQRVTKRLATPAHEIEGGSRRSQGRSCFPTSSLDWPANQDLPDSPRRARLSSSLKDPTGANQRRQIHGMSRHDGVGIPTVAPAKDGLTASSRARYEAVGRRYLMNGRLAHDPIANRSRNVLPVSGQGSAARLQPSTTNVAGFAFSRAGPSPRPHGAEIPRRRAYVPSRTPSDTSIARR